MFVFFLIFSVNLWHIFGEIWFVNAAQREYFGISKVNQLKINFHFPFHFIQRIFKSSQKTVSHELLPNLSLSISFNFEWPMSTHLYGNMYRKKQDWESLSLGLSKLYSDSVQWTLSIHPSIHSPQKKIYLLSRTFFWPTESFHLSAPYLSFHWGICHHLFLHYVFESLFTTVHRLLNANGKKQKRARRQKHIRIPSLPQVLGFTQLLPEIFLPFLCCVDTV